MSKPRVISLFRQMDFADRFPGIRLIGSPVDFFVECKSYDLEIPVNGERKKELDLFEEAVLRMVQIKKCSPKKLADILCLELDLVHFILIRLKENGLLVDNQTISEKGEEILKQQAKMKSETEFVQGKLFLITKTEMILPYIHVGEFESEPVDAFDSSCVTLGYGSAGGPQKIQGRRLYGDRSQMPGRIDTRVLRKKILLFNRIAAAQNQESIPLNEEYGILSSIGENIYFHFKAVLQEGNIDEVICSDGFVRNVDGMMDFVKEEEPELFRELKKQAARITLGTSGGTSDDCSVEKTTVEMPVKYKELWIHYQNACRYQTVGRYDEVAIDERKERNEGKRQILIECYSMLEWAFYDYIMQNQVSLEMISWLKRRSAHLNAQTLTAVARSIGIGNYVIKKSRNLFGHLDNSKIYSVYRYQTPQMYACLPLAIVEAKENSDSRIHNLVQKDSSFLEFISLLNDHCRGLRHDIDADAIEVDVDEVLNRTVKIVQTILPDIVLEGMAPKEETGDASQKRLSAQVYLEKALGSVYFHTMSKSLKNEWIKISPDKKTGQLPQPWEYIMILSRILEYGLREAGKRLAGSKMSWDEAVKKAEERYGGKIPETLRSVRHRNYEKALQQQSSTLGAAAVVYYISEDEEAVEKLNEAGFIPVLDKIICLRGHGTMVVFQETAASLNKLREDVMKLSKIIGGFYG